MEQGAQGPMQTFEVNRTPYFDIEDTIAEVGITRRQLGHWESLGLMQSELGPESKKYTVQDIRRLKALRHLIVDQKLPIPLVKEIVSGGIQHGVSFSRLLAETAALFTEPSTDLADYALDFESKRLSKRSDLADTWWNEHFALATEREVERKVYDLVLLLFRIVQTRLTTPAAFEERRDEILRELADLSDTSRVQVLRVGPESGDLDFYRWPELRGEPPLLDDPTTRAKFVHKANRLIKYRKALFSRLGPNDPRLPAYRARFWDEEDLKGLIPPRTDMNDIPF